MCIIKVGQYNRVTEFGGRDVYWWIWPHLGHIRLHYCSQSNNLSALSSPPFSWLVGRSHPYACAFCYVHVYVHVCICCVYLLCTCMFTMCICIYYVYVYLLCPCPFCHVHVSIVYAHTITHKQTVIATDYVNVQNYITDYIDFIQTYGECDLEKTIIEIHHDTELFSCLFPTNVNDIQCWPSGYKQ